MRRLLFSIVLSLCVAGVAQGQVAGFGWDPVPAGPAAAELARITSPLYGDQIATLVDRADDSDALLYQWLAAALEVDRVDALNQGRAGTCVGFATIQALSVTHAVEILHKGDRERWVAYYSPDAIYAMGREIAGALGPSDGSTGAWSCRAIREWGTVVMRSYGDGLLDLSTYEPERAQRWARVGVPEDIKSAARPYPVRATTLIKSTDEAKACLQNGYCLVVCSRESYVAQRDELGFARNDHRRRWPHAMCVVAYRGQSSGRTGFLILNSWGPDWCSGGYWPPDQPRGSFWVTVADLQRHLNAGDSWAVGDITGFPAKSITIRKAVDFGGKRDEFPYAIAP